MKPFFPTAAIAASAAGTVSYVPIRTMKGADRATLSTVPTRLAVDCASSAVAKGPSVTAYAFLDRALTTKLDPRAMVLEISAAALGSWTPCTSARTSSHERATSVATFANTVASPPSA